MKKKDLFPKISVYRDYISNLNEIVDLIKKSEQENFVSSFIAPWKQWSNLGKMSESPSIYLFQNSSIDISEEKIYFNILKYSETIKKIIHEYINQWKNVGDWKFDPKNWTIGEYESSLRYTSTTYLMYDTSKPNARIAMAYHTDQHQFDTEAPNNHHLITVTTYLNDDYSNGELSFLDEENLSLSYYKPKKGDVVVFPSFYPYFHGVEPITSGKKFLARTFITCKSEGSKEWHMNHEKFGTKWLEMEENRIKNEWSNSKYFRAPVFIDDSEHQIKILNDETGKTISFPYTRAEAKQKFMIEWND